MGLYYLITQIPIVRDDFFPAYLRLSASASGALLNAVGIDTTVQGQTLISSRGPRVLIARGCDAVAPSALFISAVLASPVPLLSRLTAILMGTTVLMLLNLVRIISLFLIRVHWPAAFKTMHLDVWQALFILTAVFIWMVWASRAARKLGMAKHVST